MATISYAARPETRADPEIRAEVLSLVLHGMMVVSVVAAMHRVDTGDRATVLAPLALGGLALGYFLSRTFVQDMLAHSVALWSGAIASILLVAVVVTGPRELVDSRGKAVLDLITGVGGSIYGDRSSQVKDDELLVVLGITAWLLAYSSAWVLYRRRWFSLGVTVPALILLTSIRVDNRGGGWPLAVFVFAAIALAARHAVVTNTARWERRNVPTGHGLASRFVLSGLPIAIASVAVAVLVNPSTHHALSVPSRDRVQQEWSRMANRVLDGLGLKTPGEKSFASFPDKFKISSDVDLSDEVVALVKEDRPHYLATRRYDVWDGQYWSSDVQSTFLMEGDDPGQQVTNVVFLESQPAALSANVTDARIPESAIITVVRPKDDLIFTIETFSSASEQVSAVLGWRKLDDVAFTVDSVELSAVPVDLQNLIRTVRNAPFAVDPANGEVTLTDGAVREAFDSARAGLAIYPINARLTVDTNGQLQVVVSGRIPNYDDIESLFTNGVLRPNDDYQVIGLSSIASPDQLASASITYPVWVTNRYLQLPGAITERTRSAAQSIVIKANASNPFDSVWAVQEYLRSNYAYELKSPAPPNGQESVDYFLFDHTAGHCEQFASAMVVLVRSLGIPARLVSGYNYSGEVDASGNVVYRENQAHTWVEVYFPGYGWIPFEPTANRDEFTYGANGQDQSDASQGDQATPTPEPTTEPELLPSPTVEATPSVPQLVTHPEDSGGTGVAVGCSWAPPC